MDFSGGADNRAFRATSAHGEPYYYINAYLDLTGLHTGVIVETDPYIFYFNKENNFNYLNKSLNPRIDDYGKYYMIDPNAVIGEVAVYAHPSIIYEGDILDLNFEVGGVYKPSIALDETLSNLNLSQSMDVWGGPTGNAPGSITVAELEDGQICYYGREPADPQPNPENDDDLEYGARRYLALRFVPVGPLLVSESKESESAPQRSARPIPRAYRPRPGKTVRNPIQKQRMGVVNRQVRVIAEPLIEAGVFHVVVKVYPKGIRLGIPAPSN